MSIKDALWEDHLRLVQLVPNMAFSVGPTPTIEEYRLRGLYNNVTLTHRNWWLAMTLEEQLGLPPAFPQALNKKIMSHYGFKCEYEGRMFYTMFHATYAAKHFLNTLLHGVTYKWTSPRMITADNGMTIKGEYDGQLEDALEHEFTENEKKWRAPQPYPYYWARFLGKRELPSIDYMMPKHLLIGSEVPPDPVKPKQRRAPTPIEKQTKVKAKVATGQYVTANQIATELNVEGRVIRGMLRTLQVAKPEHGWAWPPSEAEKIKAKIKARLK